VGLVTHECFVTSVLPVGLRGASGVHGMFVAAIGLPQVMSYETASLDTPVRLDVWADIACPWCYLGHARLEAVLEEKAAAGEVVRVRHRPFELNPGLPPEGVPMAGFLEARFGSADALRDAQARIAAMGRELGLAYDFGSVGKAPNSRLAHHLLSTYDDDPCQGVAVKALYRAYFEQGLDITDAETLIEAVSRATGEQPADVRRRLAWPTDAVDAAFALGRELGVVAVPTFVADAGTDVDPGVGLSAAAVAVEGAQPHEVLVRVLDEARRRANA